MSEHHVRGEGRSILSVVFGFIGLLTASMPMYLLAAWSYATVFWATATPETKGWMIILFPVLLVPPFVPWLVVAAPMAAALSIRNIAIRCGLIVGMIIGLSAIEERFFVARDAAGEIAASAIGTLTFEPFVGGVWLLTIGAFLITRRRTPVDAG